ncbi:MAG: AAA family ATPase [Candidatus Micrarchaeia archaeon]
MADQIIVITGTPGVGKTTFAKKLNKIMNAKLVEANEVISKYKLYTGTDKYGTKIVKMRSLEKKLNEIAAKEKGPLILEGHILADIRIKGAIAIVLREHLTELKERLKKRHYASEKIMDNLVSEATDYCGIEASRRYKKVFEFYSRDKSLEKKILNAIKGKAEGEYIELLPELKQILNHKEIFSKSAA